jgi:hypothetical protein
VKSEVVEMDIPTLKTKLKQMSERSHKRVDNIGSEKYGTRQPSYHFYMGAYVVIDNIIKAIEDDDIKTLDGWSKR